MCHPPISACKYYKMFTFMIHALKTKVLSSCRPISLIYGSEDRENLGPLIKLKCAQQQVWPNPILVVFSLDYIEQKSGQSLWKFGMKFFNNNLCNHCTKTFVLLFDESCQISSY